jgi:hypothetical protein
LLGELRGIFVFTQTCTNWFEGIRQKPVFEKRLQTGSDRSVGFVWKRTYKLTKLTPEVKSKKKDVGNFQQFSFL